MIVTVVGTGYVGLVTGLAFAKLGHEVICIDKEESKIDALKRAQAPIFEPGLEELLKEQTTNGNIRFATSMSVPWSSDIAFIAVGTPSLSTGEADLTAVFEVVDELAQMLQRNSIIGTKSTVPVGTAHKIRMRLALLGRQDISVVSVPEFLREGSAIHDTFHPSRLVFGVRDQRSEQVLRELHAGLDAPIVVTENETAEMIKYASNAFLATKISFINEIANICDRVGADVATVSRAMGLDPRIGSSFLRAGLGYGGSCFPKDTKALVNIAGQADYDFLLLKAVVEVNQLQRLRPLSKLREWLGELRGKTVTLLGTAFKPGTDDVRESPALDLAQVLEADGVIVRFCDPVVRSLEGVFGDPIDVIADAYEALTDADAAVLVTEWNEFIELDWAHVADIMASPYIFDGRNVLDPRKMRTCGIVLSNIGMSAASQNLTLSLIHI